MTFKIFIYVGRDRVHTQGYRRQPVVKFGGSSEETKRGREEGEFRLGLKGRKVQVQYRRRTRAAPDRPMKNSFLILSFSFSHMRQLHAA